MKTISILLLLFAFSAQARDEIRIVGSSTLYPFVTIAAEKFGKISGHTPVVEATGTGGGFHLFCAGSSLHYPDIVNASRQMKLSEKKLCQKNGVNNVKEIMLGYDGIIIAQSTNAENVNFTKEQLFMALTKKIFLNGKMIENPYQKWQEIAPQLPTSKIEVYGPSFTSGTRDAFIELVMQKFGSNMIREDGRYIEMSENDNLIIQKLLHNDAAFGIISFSLLAENPKIKAATIANITPNNETIVNGKYPLARPLYIYVNLDHFKELPILKEFIAEVTSSRSLGENGYLTQKGLLTKASIISN